MWKPALVGTLLLVAACSNTGYGPPARTSWVVPSSPPFSKDLPAEAQGVPTQSRTGGENRAGHAKERPSALSVGFLEALLAGNYDEAHGLFNSFMKTSLPESELAGRWKQLLAKAGAFVRVERWQNFSAPPRTHVWFECTFQKGGWFVEVVTDGEQEQKISGFQFTPVPPAWTAPSYADTTSIVEHAVRLGSPPLDAILTRPTGKVRGAVVLVHGSGAQDQDASAGPFGSGTRMFKDLAWGLATHGIAVLRYPKRMSVYPHQFENVAFDLDDEVTKDACLAVDVAARELSIARRSVALAGHSLGAAMAPRIARTCPELGGLVLLAGPSRSLDEVLLDQAHYLSQLQKKTTREQQGQVADLALGFTRAVGSVGPMDEDIRFGGMRGPRSYWIDVSRYDPPGAASQIECPMLLLQGGRDYQVPKQDFDHWKQVLRGRSDVAFKFYPTLDHRFVDGIGRPGPIDVVRQGHVAYEVVHDIASWVEWERTESAPVSQR